MGEYKFCKKWPGYSYSYETIKSEVEKVKKQTNDNGKEEKEEKVMGIYDYIIYIYSRYYFIILPALILIIIFIIVKKKKKYELF